jgi:general secretion pathway protein D
LSASVYALDWADSTDLLYSPRVTTLAGSTARVDMTEAHCYPDEYEDSDSELTIHEGKKYGYYFAVPQATLGDPERLGIQFSITPQVDGNLIRAAVNFNIRQFDSWMIIDSRTPPIPDTEGGDSDDSDGEDYQKKPVFTVRSISTQVALQDGETVLIGSVSQDLTTSLHDRIPILADIPFIGRLFQSRYTVSKKSNLLIFMTCRLINPDGTAVNGGSVSGEPGPGGQQSGLPQFPVNQ